MRAAFTLVSSALVFTRLAAGSRARTSSRQLRSSPHASRMGLFDAFTGGRSSAPSDPAVYASVVDAAPSWDELKAMSCRAGGTRFRALWEEQAAGRGPANHQAALRLFDAPAGTEPRVELYRDTAAWCPYCQKVWMLLEAKRIPYKVSKVPMSCYGDKPPAFRRISPSGGIPVAIIDGKVIAESNDIVSRAARPLLTAPAVAGPSP